MTKTPSDGSYDEDETERRMNAAVKRALNTPPRTKDWEDAYAGAG